MRLKDQVALVTGASRGIGRAIAESLAKEGAEVVLTARSADELKRVQQSIESSGGKARAVQADISVPEDVANVFRMISAEFRRLHILVNNAGIGTFAPVKELTLSDFDAMWNVNLRGVFLCSQHALKLMIPQKQGDIVNISSLAGKNSFVNGAGYAATKWGLMGFTNCLRLEVREHNVRVTTICPGSVATEFSPEASNPDRAAKIIAAKDVADTVLHVVTMPRRAMVSEIDIRPTNPK